jgi:hypothetical protein
MLYSRTEQGHRSSPHTLYMREWIRKNPSYYTNLFNRLWNELRQSFGGKCVICGQIWELEFAHIKETGLSGEGRGQRKRYYDIKNHPDCYTLMCKKDHKDFDKISSELKEEWLKKNRKF